jgi:hypothetical protein
MEAIPDLLIKDPDAPQRRYKSKTLRVEVLKA